MSLFKERITFVVKRDKNNLKAANYFFEKIFGIDGLKGFAKLFSILYAEKIYECIQKGFEKEMDNIYLGEEDFDIKLMINMMDVVTEQISFQL